MQHVYTFTSYTIWCCLCKEKNDWRNSGGTLQQKETKKRKEGKREKKLEKERTRERKGEKREKRKEKDRQRETKREKDT